MSKQMWVITIMAILVAASGFTAYGAENEDPLFAGIARVEITPPTGVPMCGYSETATANGINDPLFARILVLKAGDTSLCIVSADLVYFWSDKIIAEAKQKHGINYVLLCGSHTHAGPTPVGMGVSPGIADAIRIRDEWYSGVEDKVIAAIGEAASSLFPASIGFGKGAVDSKYFAYNRRKVSQDGKSVQMWWENHGRRPNGPIDPNVYVIRVDDNNGKTRALMVQYAAHPVTLGGNNRMISADFPGPMASYMEEQLGEGAIAMFAQGAGGDTHPFDAVMNGNEAGFKAVRDNGVSLGKSAMSVAKGIKMDSGPASIKAKESLIRMAYRKDPKKFDDAAVMAIVINNNIAMGALIYEPFVEHQLALMEKSPVKNTMFIGYSYFGQGIKLDTYLPTVAATKEGGYGAGAGAGDYNVFEIGAGEKMVDNAVEMIREMAGEGKN